MDLRGVFHLVRAMPYATDRAHDADSLLRLGAGDCLAKAAYLLGAAGALGVEARRVRWRYELSDQPPEVLLLRSRVDVHTAVEIRLDGRWVLLDATHDLPLASIGFTVADWDGRTSTLPAYPPIGPVWRPGDGPEPHIDGGPDPAGPTYQAAFNRWLRKARP